MVPTLLRAAALSLLVLFPFAACSSSSSTNGPTSPDGGLSCGSCAEVYTNGGIACGPGDSSDAWQALALCACGAGPCASVCMPTFCTILPADEDCGMCLITSCAAQEMDCAAN
jgi:hypothetical protein